MRPSPKASYHKVIHEHSSYGGHLASQASHSMPPTPALHHRSFIYSVIPSASAADTCLVPGPGLGIGNQKPQP